jgi:hypothetical protein
MTKAYTTRDLLNNKLCGISFLIADCEIEDTNETFCIALVSLPENLGGTIILECNATSNPFIEWDSWQYFCDTLEQYRNTQKLHYPKVSIWSKEDWLANGFEYKG